MAINSELMDKIADALNKLGSVQVIQDAVIQGCPHFSDRVIVHFRVHDDALWVGVGGHLRTILSLIDEARPRLNVHICRQWVYDRTRPKDLVVLQTFEVEGTNETVEQVVAILDRCRNARVDPRVPETRLPIGGTDGRTQSIDSERYGPANLRTGGGGSGSGGIRTSR